jgi:carbamoyltransferase
MKDKNHPWILGVASSHNGGVCLLRGDEIVIAIQEERLLRYKRAAHPPAKPSLALQYCLDTTGIKPADLSAVIVCSSWSAKHPMEDISLNAFLRPIENEIQIFRIGHHLGHAIGSFATSGFKEAAVLVIDAAGSPVDDLEDEECKNLKRIQLDKQIARPNTDIAEVISLYFIDETKVITLEKHVSPKFVQLKEGMPYFASFGMLYAAVGQQIFGVWLDGAGKVMGLAPYGRRTIPIDGFFEIVDDEFYMKTTVPLRYTHSDRWPLRQDEYKDLAASSQAALEEGILYLVRRIRMLTGSNTLCYSGGVALNSIANERIVRESGFDNVFIMPAAEDSGTAIGAAYYGLWKIIGRNTGRKLIRDAVGRQYTAAEIDRAISVFPVLHVSRPDDIINETVELLCQGKVIGWFQGGSELGPRALGQRSILCDPRREEMKDRLNAVVKFREGFRPFAPVILREKLGEWFETYGENDESPYMLRVMRFHEEAKKRVPAVTHVDGTGRVQTVTSEANQRLYDLLRRFYDRTGVPILLNTSFNTSGEPIVESPEDALCCLLFTGMDGCILEDYLVKKGAEFSSPLDLYVLLTAEQILVDLPGKANFTKSDGRYHWNPIRFDFFRSFPLGHSDDLERYILRYRDIQTDFESPPTLLRIVTSTPFGHVVHVTTTLIFDILKQCNGKRTGWQLLDSLNASGSAKYDEATFCKILARLRRASIVSLHLRAIDT